MANKFFGTDGIRGRTNAGVMTAATAMKVGQAAGRHFLRGDHRHRVVIGKDTRLSGYMMENALVAGFTSVGMDVVMTGPLPTPAIAMLTRELRADVGVMISASHNPYEDNGIKLFGPDGFKLSDDDETAIEALIGSELELADAAEVGRARRIDDARGRYIHAVKQSRAQRHPLRRSQGGGRLRQRRRLPGRPERDLGAWRQGHRARRHPQRDQHQRRGGLDLARGDQGQGGRGGRRHRHRARWRRRPADRGRRKGPDGRRRPDHGADRGADGRTGPAARRRGGRHGDVEPRARAAPRRPRARRSNAPRWATATCSSGCARAASTSAASSRGT